MSGKLAGKVAIVTGAASGIGFATAKRFVEEDARVVMADLNGKMLEKASATLGEQTVAIPTDVTEQASVTSLFTRAKERFEKINVLVNCAGISRPEPLGSLKLETWNATIGVNLTGTFLTAQAAANEMMAHGGGTIVLISSMGYLGNAVDVAYSASKGGVVSLMRSMALALGKHSIRVNAIAPGFTETPMTMRPGEGLRPVRRPNALGRNGQASEIAAVALFLASDESSFVSGHVLFADGAHSTGDAPA